MKKLTFIFACLSLCCCLLSSCGGGGGNKSDNYSLSVRDFMRGAKCILISGGDCAFAIVPKQFDPSAIHGPDVICDGRILVYKNAEMTAIRASYDVADMTYSVDENGVGYLTCPGVETYSIDDDWMRMCGVLAGTGGTYGAGQEGNYATISNLTFILNFGGDDRGQWEEGCHVIMGQLVADLQASGSLYLRPKDKLGL